MSTPIGSDKEFLAACATAPEDLTDRDLEIVNSTHPEWAKTMRAERTRALESKSAAITAETARARASRSHAPLTGYSIGLAVAKELHERGFGGFANVDALLAWCVKDQHRLLPAPIAFVADLYEFVEDMNKRNAERNERIAALEAKIAVLESCRDGAANEGPDRSLVDVKRALGGFEMRARDVEEVVALTESRVKALEERPWLEWVGIWSPAVTYKKGQCVTHRGSMWVCKTRSCGKRPPNEEWQQVVQRGADGKDLRPEAAPR